MIVTRRLKSSICTLLSFILLFVVSATSAELPGFRVVGRHLYDRCGEKVILRGVNKMTVWTDINGESFPEMAKTGANVVRIVWITTGAVDKFDAVITKCVENKMIPMVELHDATGEWDKLPAMVDWWTKDEVVSVIQKHEEYLLVNIANECGNTVSNADFLSGYSTAVTRMREAGIHVPIVIDGAGWGKDINILQATGPDLITTDPDHNLLFSVHMWWIPDWGYNDQTITSEIAQSVQMNLPLIVGEFGNTAASCVGTINYKLIMKECQENEIGWLAWSWGPGNSDCPSMDMTTDSKFETLSGWGLEVAVTDEYSIKNTSVRPKSILNGACEGDQTTRFAVSVLTTGRGTVSIEPNRVMVDSGTVLTFTASPGENNEFLNWSGSAEGSQNPLTITVTENVNLTAVFSNNGPAVGKELVTNGDFSDGSTGWKFAAFEDAKGTSSVESGELAITMTAAGTEGWHAQLNTTGLDISSGKTYQVSFKARASVPFDLPMNIGLNEDPWTTYSGYQTLSVSTEMETFSFEFTMNEADDQSARIVFDLGSFSGSIFFDDISIKTIGGSSISNNNINPKFRGNSFSVMPRGNGVFTIKSGSSLKGSFRLLDISGRCLAELSPAFYKPGIHHLRFGSKPVLSGTYFIQLDNSGKRYTERVVNILR